MKNVASSELNLGYNDLMERFYIILAIPVFILLMCQEAWLAKRNHRQIYSLSDTIANIGCGVGQQTLDLFFTLLLIPGYLLLQNHLKLFSIPNNWQTGILLFVVIDLIYYLYHRLSHYVPLLWAVHVVHHQSEKFNFSVGLRQAWFHKIVSFPIYIPPAIFGFDAKFYFGIAALHAVAQIWTHTQMFDGNHSVLRFVFVTPSHHRVHHGRDDIYLNRNFGGILSLWDYLFGSFQAEGKKPDFGVVDGNPDDNAWLAQWRGLKTLWQKRSNRAAIFEVRSRAPLARGIFAMVGYVLLTIYFPEMGWYERGAIGAIVIGLLALS